MTPLQLVLQQVLAPVVGAALTILAAFLVNQVVKLTPVVIGFFEDQVQLVRSKLTSEQLAILDLVVTRAVQAAEQSAEIGLILKEGKTKKEYALKIVQDELDRLGVPFDLVDAEHRIEAAINQALEQKPLGLATLEATPLASFEARYSKPVVTVGDLPATVSTGTVSNG